MARRSPQQGKPITTLRGEATASKPPARPTTPATPTPPSPQPSSVEKTVSRLLKLTSSACHAEITDALRHEIPRPNIASLPPVPDHTHRTLRSIGRRLSPSRPFCPQTVKKLVERAGLPAKQLPGKGWWAVRDEDIEAWIEEYMAREEEERAGKGGGGGKVGKIKNKKP